jgi:hypothetical protein
MPAVILMLIFSVTLEFPEKNTAYDVMEYIYEENKLFYSFCFNE